MRSRLDGWFVFVASLAVPMALYSAVEFPDRIATGSLVFGDGIAYFAYLPSVVFDGDLRFGNDYSALSPKVPAQPWPVTDTGLERNPFSIGTALLWSPFYLLVHPVAIWLAAEGWPFPPDGRSAIYQLAAIVGSQVYILLGLLLVYRMLCHWFERPIAALASAGILYGTVLFWYGSVTAILSHSPSFFAAALLLRLGQNLRFEPLPLALHGLGFGLCVVIRPELALYLPFALLAVFQAVRHGGPGVLRRFAVGTLYLLGGILVLFVPQFICWKVIYGSFHDSRLKGFLHPGFAPVLSVLYSSRHGLFSWTPLILPAVLGLVAFLRRDRLFASAALLGFFGYVYTIAIAADWWGGYAFGARRICSALPMLAPGLACAIQALVLRPRLAVALLLAVFVVPNLLNMEVQRQGLMGTGSDPISFAKLAEGRIDVVQRLMGSPAAFPGNLAMPLWYGIEPSRFDRLWGNQLYQDFRGELDFWRPRHVRYLGLGWSDPAILARGRTVCFVLARKATVLVQLDSGGPKPFPPTGLACTLAAVPYVHRPGIPKPGPVAFEVSVNGRLLAREVLPEGFQPVTVSVPLPDDLPWTDELNEVRFDFTGGAFRTASSLMTALRGDPALPAALGLASGDLHGLAKLAEQDRPLIAAVNHLQFSWPALSQPQPNPDLPASPDTKLYPPAPASR